MASVSSIARDRRGGLPARMRDTQATFSGFVRRCQPPATCTRFTPVSARRARSSSRAALIFAPSRSPHRRLSSATVSERSLANSRLSMMLARRPGAATGGGSTPASAPSAASPLASPPTLSPGSAGGSSAPSSAGAGWSTCVIDAAASSASSSSLPTFVGPSQLSSGETTDSAAPGGGPTWVSGSGSSKEPLSSEAAPWSMACGPERSGLVRSPSTGALTTPPASCSLVFLRLLIGLLDRRLLRGGGRRRGPPQIVDRRAGRLGDEQRLAVGRLQHAHHLQLGHLQDGHQRDHHLAPQLGLGQREVEAGLELERAL